MLNRDGDREITLKLRVIRLRPQLPTGEEMMRIYQEVLMSKDRSWVF